MLKRGKIKQESLANCKGKRARQQCVYEGPYIGKKSTANRKKLNIEKYILWVRTMSLTVRVYLYSFLSCYCLFNLRNSPKIRTYSISKSSKVIDFGANRKRICNFLLVINSNFERTLAVFEILTHSSKTACFPHPPHLV